MNPSNVASINVLWSSPSTRDFFPRPAVGNGLVYVLDDVDAGGGNSVPTMYAFDENSGALVWTTALAGKALWCQDASNLAGGLLDTNSPAVGNLALGGNGLVFVGIDSCPESSETPGPTQPSEVLALDAFTGSVVWQDSFPGVAFNGGVTLTPDVGRVGGGDSPALLVSTNGDFLTALQPQTGQTLWFSNPGPGLATQASVDGGLAYVVVNGDEVRALDLHNAGAVVWSATVAPNCNSCSTTSVSAAGSLVIVGASTGGTSNPYVAFDAATGKLIWRTNVNTGTAFSVYPAAVGLDRAFVVGVDGVHALSLSSGMQIWKSKPFNMPPSGPPTVANGVVYMTDDSTLVTFRASDGVEIGFVIPQNASHHFENEVVVSDGRVFLSTDRAGLQVYGP